MPEQLLEVVEEWRLKGVCISDEEADEVYRHCLRKMEIAKIENPGEYIFLLYPDEIKNYLFRVAVNATTMLRLMGLEAKNDVYDLQTESVPSTVS